MTALIVGKNKQLKPRTIIVIYILLFVICICMSLIIHGDIAKKIYNSAWVNKCDTEIIDTQRFSELKFNECQISEDGTYIAETDDPQIFLSLDGKRIANIKVNLKEPAEESLSWQVFYCDSDVEAFSEEKSVSGIIESGSTSCELWINQNEVTFVRIDIGNAAGQKINIENICINDKTVEGAFENISWRKVVLWAQIYFFVIGFVVLHFIVKDPKSIYENIFRFRWIIAAFVLLFFTANKLNGDSLAIYNFIQPNQGSEYIEPIIGEARYIRSDEFIVDSPSKLASGYGDYPYGQYNYIQRGTKTLNSVNGIYLGYSTIGKAPYCFVYTILDREYAYSFCWYAPIILTFMLSFELCLIIARRRRLLAFTGACLIGLSPFYLWWNFPAFLIGAQGAIVCVHYFLNSTGLIKKILYSLGFGVAFANYVLTLYPAWIVPMGYVSLLIVIWILHENWQKVKKLKLLEYLILAAGLFFSASLILSYLRVNQEYILAISNTVYPGHRVNNGGFAIPRMFSYFQNGLFGFKDIGNASEESSLFSLFPIPLIAAIYQWILTKKKDWFLSGMIGISIVYIVYSTTGLPSVIAQITLLSYCTPTRILPIIGIVQVYMMVRVLSVNQCERKFLLRPAAIAIGSATAILGILYTATNFPGYMEIGWIIVSFIVVVLAGIVILTRTNQKVQRTFEIGISCISIFIAMSIRPISIGLDSIFSKPVAKEIQNICSTYKRSKWIGYNDIRISGFLVACGAPTINSVNTYPNYEIWNVLDPERKYESYYNRYAHIAVNFIDGETNVEMIQEDYIRLNLSYDDISKIDCNYIFSMEPLNASGHHVSFDEIYNENGCYIYNVVEK